MMNSATSSSEYESECCFRSQAFVATTTSSSVGAASICRITSRSVDVTNDGSVCRASKCAAKSLADSVICAAANGASLCCSEGGTLACEATVCVCALFMCRCA